MSTIIQPPISAHVALLLAIAGDPQPLQRAPHHVRCAARQTLDALGLRAALPLDDTRTRGQRTAIAAANSLLVHVAHSSQQILLQHGVPSTALKGLSLFAHQPEALHLRPTGDVDLLVPDVHAAQTVLRQHGFSLRHDYAATFVDGLPLAEHILRQGHAFTCVSPSGVGIELHRAPLHLHFHPLHPGSLSPDTRITALGRPLTVRSRLTLLAELTLHPLLGHPADRDALTRMILDLRLIAPPALHSELRLQARQRLHSHPLYAAGALLGLHLLETARGQHGTTALRTLADLLLNPPPGPLDHLHTLVSLGGTALRILHDLRHRPSLFRYKLNPHRDWHNSTFRTAHNPRSPLQTLDTVDTSTDADP